MPDLEHNDDDGVLRLNVSASSEFNSISTALIVTPYTITMRCPLQCGIDNFNKQSITHKSRGTILYVRLIKRKPLCDCPFIAF